MRERGILFSAPMVRAIIAGTKTQTRRVAKVNDHDCKPGFITPNAGFVPRRVQDHAVYCPYGQPGDRLWVRETWALADGRNSLVPYLYRADGDSQPVLDGRWRPSIHMPREASRITLEITNVRVERLNEISQKDVMAEGAEPLTLADGGFVPLSGSDYVGGFRRLWESINGPGSWAENPLVWVIAFKRLP